MQLDYPRICYVIGQIWQLKLFHVLLGQLGYSGFLGLLGGRPLACAGWGHWRAFHGIRESLVNTLPDRRRSPDWG